MVAIIVAWRQATRDSFADPDFATGYLLFALVLFLALYGARKRLSMVPIGRVSTWLTVHVVGGVLALPLFWIHTNTVWPAGSTDQLLAGLFYVTCISGLIGYALQVWLPGRLTRAGREMIYERIPVEIAAIRTEVEQALLAGARDSGHDTLGRYYLQTLGWYFARPRFFWSHAFGGRRADHWLQRHLATIGRYLAPSERTYLTRIAELGREKRRADIQYAMQSLLKRWLIVHVPLAAAMLTLAAWHLILVHVFAR